MADSENVTSPMPSVSATTADRNEPGFFIHNRTPNRKSWSRSSSQRSSSLGHEVITRMIDKWAKHQKPNTKLQRKSKLQIPNVAALRAYWSLEIEASLVFGAWCLVFSFVVCSTS